MEPEMKEWICEMEIEAGKHSDYLKGALYRNHSGYIRFSSDPNNLKDITLDGDFTIEQLEALIEHMKKYNEAK